MHQDKRCPLWIYNTQFWAKNMGDKKRARRSTHFPKELGVSEQKLDSPLAYSSKHLKIPLVKVLPTGLLSLFKPQQLNPKKLGGKHGQKPQHNPKGNCTAEWSQFLSCSKKKKKKKNSKATPAWPCLQKFRDFFNLFQFLSVIWLKITQDFPCPMSLSC